MPIPRPLFLALGAAAVLTVGAATLFSRDARSSGFSPAPTALTSSELEEIRSHYIALYERRAEEDPWSAGDRMILSQLYMQRARETGSHEDVLRAETAARRSLELREAHNARAYGVLAMSLLEQHRFQEALQAMEQLVAAEPENAAFRAFLGEILLELGEYERADTVFASVEAAGEHLDVAPRLARWMEMRGRPGESLKLLYQARDRALRQLRLEGEQIAWFHLRLGDMELRHGRLDEAEEAFQAGLSYVPDDYRLTSAMARLAAAREDWDEAVRLGEDVIGELLDPNTLVLLSEVHAARGHTVQADEYAQVMKVAIAGQTESLHREWSLFLLDRGEDPSAIVEKAEEDLRTRRDVFGYDLLAWALHKQGKHQEARAAISKALEVGLQDAMLFYHAGMIEQALGNDQSAAQFLERALEVNPHFHPTHADEARRQLGSQGPFARFKYWLNS